MHQLKIKNKNKPNIESLILNKTFVLFKENIYISYDSSNALPYKQDFTARRILSLSNPIKQLL